MGMLEIYTITKGDEDEREFITYSMGVQLSCDMDA